MASEVKVAFVGDNTDLKKKLDEVAKKAKETEKKLDATGDAMQKWGKRAALAGVAAVAGFGAAGQAAGELEQAVGGTEAVFGEASATIDEFAKDSAKAMGLSERAFRESTTRLGGSLKALGFETDDAAQKAVDLTGVAADLAATYGGTTADAVDALGAAFRGEADPAERFNLRLNQNTVNAKAVELGLAATTSQVDAHAKAQATLALILEQSADAQGQFSRESDTLIGKQQIAKAEFENLTASIGAGVLPIMTSLLDKASSVAGAIDGLSADTKAGIGTFGTYAAAGVAVGGSLVWLGGKAIELRDKLAPIGTDGTRSMTALGKAAAGASIAIGVAGLVGSLKAAHDATDGLYLSTKKWAELNDGQLARSFEKLRDFSSDEAMKQFKLIADENVETARRLADGLDELGVNTDDYRQILEGEIVAQKQSSKDSAAAAEIIEGDVAPAYKGAAEEVDTFADKLDDAKAAIDRHLDVAFTLEEAVSNWESAYDDLAEALTENGTSLDISTEKGRANRDALREIVDASGEVVQAAIDRGASSEDVQRIIDQEKVKLYELALQFGLPRAAVEEYTRKLDDIPAIVRTRLEIDEIMNRAVQAGGLSSYGRNAAGTDNWRGGPTVVGELGPEVVNLPQGSQVIPNSHLGGMGSAPAPIFNFNFSGPVGNERQLQEWVMSAIEAAKLSGFANPFAGN